MIKGVGTDIVSIRRIEEALKIKGFKEKTFSVNEIANVHGLESAYYAKRFAGKEAVYKATSFIGNYDLRQIEILNNLDGSPYVVISDFLKAKGINKIYLSIADEAEYAVAYCVVEE